MKCPLCEYRARVDKKTLSRQEHYGPRVAQLFVDHMRRRHTGVVSVESYYVSKCALCGLTVYTSLQLAKHWEDAGGLAEHILEWRLK